MFAFISKLLGKTWIKYILLILALLIAWVMVINWDSNRFERFRGEVVSVWTDKTQTIENEEIKKDAQILQDNIDKPISDVVDSLQSACRDCNSEQKIRVLRAEGDYRILSRHIDGTNSKADRHTKPDPAKALPCVPSYSINPNTNEIEKGCY